jgi:hypothetical protein
MTRESVQQRTKIAEPWVVEAAVYEDMVMIDLVNMKTGEIRRKHVSLDTLARRVFKSEIKTWDKYGYPVKIEKRGGK